MATFGELLLRVATQDHELWTQAQRVHVTYGGAEANVAVGLAHLGTPSRFLTRVPDSPIARGGLTRLEGRGVDTSRVVFGGDRLGVYFLEPGVAQRPSRVVYDRAGSSMATIGDGDFDWPLALNGCRWFHTTGITPALSATAASVTLKAAASARALGMTVSVDLNHRAQLWHWTESATPVMSELLSHADVVFSNEEDLNRVFGIQIPVSDPTSQGVSANRYLEPCRQLRELFPNLKSVAVTVRESVSASDNVWSAALSAGDGFHLSRSYRISPVLDRVGAGDAFAAAAIHCMISNSQSAQDTLEFATAAACLKHSVPGDWNLIDVADIRRLLDGDGSGRILR